MEESKPKSSRRQFLKGAALFGAAGVASACAAPAATPAPAPTCPPAPTAAPEKVCPPAPTAAPCPTAAPAKPMADLPSKWDYETDVVVIGYGGAGAAATIEATKAGAKVIMLEKTKAGGGSTAICGGLIYMGGGTPVQKAAGFEDTRDNMYKYLFAAVGEGADPDMVGLYCDKSLELYKWLDDLGLKFKQSYLAGKYATPMTDDGLAYSGNESIAEFAAIAQPVPRGHHAGKGMGGAAIFAPLKKAVEASGAQVLFESPAKKLLTDLTGRVVGVVASVGGTDKFIKARRGVVLSAGTYHSNKDMVAQYAPAWTLTKTVTGTPADDGSGIKMGQMVGADLSRIGTCTGFGGTYLYSEAMVKGILVNDAGQRYIGEDGYGSRIGVRVVERNPVSYIIADSAVWKEVPEAVQGIMKPTAQANTIAELAAAIKVPAAALESTVKLYNAMVEAGEDAMFQKDKHYLVPLATAPFYAFAWGADRVSLQALGGLKVNTKSQVLDPAGKPIQSLYSAGANTSGIISRYYPGSGTAVGSALTFGRIAGVNVAAEKAWE